MPSDRNFDTPSDFEEELERLENAFIEARVPKLPFNYTTDWTAWFRTPESLAHRAKQTQARAEFFKEVLRRVWYFGPMDDDLIEVTRIDSNKREFIKPYPNNGD